MNLNDFRVGTRLAAGFGTILVFLASMAAAGIWQMNSSAAATREMMATSLVKERLVSEQVGIVGSGLLRTKGIANSTDVGLETVYAEDLKASTARIEEIVAAMKLLPTGADEQKILDKVNESRAAVVASRTAMMKAKRAGDHAGASTIYTRDYIPAVTPYFAGMLAFRDYQRSAMDRAAADNLAGSSRGARFLAAVGALALVVGAILAWLLTRSITRPVSEALRIAEAVARGDLTQQLYVEGRDELATLIAAMGAMNASLRQVVSKILESAGSIKTASLEVANGNKDLSQRTEQMASNLEETAASMEQLTSTVMNNADTARQANQLATQAGEAASKGGNVVGQVVGTMEQISASSKKIADIIGVIDGIAFQTNILALNAAVEAARAGEQGRGFAVVASEVRSLAGRSAEAAREIKVLIGESVGRVEAGSKLADDAGRAMEDIVNQVSRVTQLIAAISAAGAEQTQGINQVSDAVNQLDQVTQQNAALVEQSAAAADSLSQQATRLTEVVGGFTLGGEVNL
jgi:methyl-accepting chemotaxis protein